MALLMIAIVAVCTFGSAGVERMFKVSSLVLYAIYFLFVVVAFSYFGDRSLANLSAPVPAEGWVSGGLFYASYNVVGVIAVLPFLVHQRSRRDAVVSGLLAGPLAMLPGLMFFIAMIAFYPAIGAEALPSNYLLAQIGIWQRGDIGQCPEFGGDIGRALAAIKARVLLMPGQTDRYFDMRDNEAEISGLVNAKSAEPL